MMVVVETISARSTQPLRRMVRERHRAVFPTYRTQPKCGATTQASNSSFILSNPLFYVLIL